MIVPFPTLLQVKQHAAKQESLKSRRRAPVTEGLLFSGLFFDVGEDKTIYKVVQVSLVTPTAFISSGALAYVDRQLGQQYAVPSVKAVIAPRLATYIVDAPTETDAERNRRKKRQ